ncbi:hypothetical protein Btru_016073 [Bulinus truncatus]|nr:hypothetical protein Btru_016073 [Bulinus truncatus]
MSTACSCHPKGAETGFCDITSGKCQCKLNILTLNDKANITLVNGTNIMIDGTCSHCFPNYYGIDSGQGCLPCNCNVNGSTDQQCDETGQCPCKDTVTGLKCDICKDGYFDFGPNGCSPCNCSTSGSSQITCNQLNGTCACKSNVEGTKCTVCKTGFFNLASYNPDGCQPCFCYNHSLSCTSAVGYQLKVLQAANPASPEDYGILLGDRHWSYGQSLTVKFAVIKEIDLTNEILISLTGAERQTGGLHYCERECSSIVIFSSITNRAFQKKPHTIAEELILPAAVDMCEVRQDTALAVQQIVTVVVLASMFPEVLSAVRQSHQCPANIFYDVLVRNFILCCYCDEDQVQVQTGH